jgi:hypothetical protein
MFAVGKKRSECTLLEELCGHAVSPNVGHVHQEQAPTCHLPPSHMPVVCESEDIFPAVLALLLGNVFVQPEEQRPENEPCCAR